MLLGLLKQSFTNQKRAMALMIISVSMGTAVSAALITISLDIKEKVSKELRSFGANIIVEPKVEGFADIAGQKRYLKEEDIVKIKTIFWRHNIIGVAPFLETNITLSSGGIIKSVETSGAWFNKVLPLPGESAGFEAGIETVLPWWDINGKPPAKGELLLGVSLAEQMGAHAGSVITAEGKPYTVSGLLSGGGKEDGMAFMELDELQSLKGLEGAVSKVMVSALTTPMDEFAYKDPKAMTRKEYEKWYCTGYVTSISKQVEEVFSGSRAKPIWNVAETEGNVLSRLSVLIYLLTAATLLASSLGMSTTMAASILRRLDEVALMKSVGADSLNISVIFLSEAFIIGAVGGVIGYVMSIFVTGIIGVKVFSTALAGRKALLFFVSIASALLIASAGSMLPIRRALRVKPAIVLKEGK